MSSTLVKPRLRVILGAILAASLSLLPAAVAAQQAYSNWGLVRSLEAGWAADTISLVHSQPVVNAGACNPGTQSTSYATAPDDPGRALYQTLLLSAFLNRKEVRVLVNGCVYSKPRIISVSIR